MVERNKEETEGRWVPGLAWRCDRVHPSRNSGRGFVAAVLAVINLSLDPFVEKLYVRVYTSNVRDGAAQRAPMTEAD